MSDILQIAQLVLSSLLIPAVAYIIKLEKRIFALEYKVDTILQNTSRRRVDKKSIP
ncbi:MAG: hypothetical protein AAB721_01780 [Patescibacteria group bacterium]